MSRVCVGIFHKSEGTSEIAQHKNNVCVLQSRLIKDELVLVFIPYYP